MEDESKIKAAKAKLYNLKSGIEGLITLMDSGSIAPDGALDAVCTLAAKAVEDYNKQCS